MEDDIMKQAGDLLNEKYDESWRDISYNIHLMNALITGYSIALHKTLGAGAGAMTQILLTEVGEVLSGMVDIILGDEQVAFEKENLDEIIKSALLKLGIAEDVVIESSMDGDMEIHKIYIKKSLFNSTHQILIGKGIKEFPLSPEGLLCASIVRRVLREKTGGDANARINVNTKLPVDGETVIVEIKQIAKLK